MSRFKTWAILLFALIATSSILWAADHGRITISSNEIAITLSIAAILALVMQRRKIGISNSKPNFLPPALSGVALLIVGIGMIVSSVAWLIVSLLLRTSEYVIAVPFAVLFFGGAAVLGIWTGFRNMQR